MIRTEVEFKRTVARVTELHLQLVDLREQLQLAGLEDEQIEEMTGGLSAKCRQFEDDIAIYERRMARTWVAAS
jgi:hypothetical protein